MVKQRWGVNAMKCPYCGHEETKVVDSRDVDETIRRRRECESCEKRFTSYERIQHVELYVVKKDGRREPYDRSKLLRGIQKACEKRPVGQDTLESVIDDIEMKLRSSEGVEVKSTKIGEMVMARLKKIDPIAYVRFASVYQEFNDAEAFEKALESLRKLKG